MNVLSGIESGINDSISNNFARIRIDSYNSLPIDQTLTFRNAIIFINVIVNKDKNIHKRINPIHNIFKLIFVYYKCYILIELTFLKELILLRQANQKSAILSTTGSF